MASDGHNASLRRIVPTFSSSRVTAEVQAEIPLARPTLLVPDASGQEGPLLGWRLRNPRYDETTPARLERRVLSNALGAFGVPEVDCRDGRSGRTGPGLAAGDRRL